MTCKHPTCTRRAQKPEESVFALCTRHIDLLFVYVCKAPVKGKPGVTSVSTPRRSALWLVGAVLAGGVAVAVTVADQMIARGEDRTASGALAGDVERISALFDGAARSTHMRADGIATTPMLRAAIETDAATLGDMATTEMVFTAGKSEALEVFQFSGSRANTLLRIPRTAPALAPLKGRSTEIRSDGRTLTLLASAPISGYRAGAAGGIVISTPVDLTAIQRGLAEHCAGASLTGLGRDLVLIDAGGSTGGTAVKLAIPSSGEWTAGATALVATPKPSAGLSWAKPTRLLSGGLSALLLIGFIASLVRRPRD